MRRPALLLLSAACLFLAAACSDEATLQDKFTGVWQLQSRKAADGTTVQPPGISGLMEWFVIDRDRGHVTIALSSGVDDLQFEGAVYTITEGSFTREVYLRINGGYRPLAQPGYSTSATTDSGQIQGLDTDRVVLAHAGKFTFTFEGSVLTVVHADNTVDTWKKKE